MPFVLLGAGLLWFGWFGFNAGSALAASPIAGLAFVTTMLAPAATLMVWTLLDFMRSGKADGGRRGHGDRRRPRGRHAGRRLHQPDERAAARRASPRCRATSRLIIRVKTSLDDSLDVVAAHGVGGTVGALLTGVFAEKALNGLADGALYGNPGQLGIQAAAILAAIVYSGVVTFILLKVIGLVLPLRATDNDESEGLDISMHGEEAYLHAGGMDVMTREVVEAAPFGAPQPIPGSVTSMLFACHARATVSAWP